MSVPAAPASARIRRRRHRQVFALIGLATGVALAALLAWREAIYRENLRHLDAVTAELDRLDPGWRYEDLLAARPRLPDADNGAELVDHFYEQLRDFSKAEGMSGSNGGQYWSADGVEPNRLVPERRWKPIAAATAEHERVLSRLDQIRAKPRGVFRIDGAEEGFLVLSLEHVQRARTIASALRWHALRLAQAGDADGGLRQVEALLTVSGYFEHEFFLISHLVNIALDAIALGMMERALASGETTIDLGPLERLWAREASGAGLARAMRGERAGCEHFWRLMRGKGYYFTNGPMPPAVRRALAFAYRPYGPGDVALMLGYMNQAVAIAKLPPGERQAGFAAVPALPVKEWRYNMTAMLLPGVNKVVHADRRNVAQCRTALVMLQCERFRRAAGRYPLDAGELGEVPADPYDGRPIRVRPTPEGLVVYTVGPDGIDDGGKLDPTRRPETAGCDHGYRLWLPQYRRLAALPEKLDPDEEHHALAILGGVRALAIEEGDPPGVSLALPPAMRPEPRSPGRP